MAIRTTAAAVKKIIETDDNFIKEDTDLDPFIEIASSVVDNVLEANETYTYTPEMLELIERWLSAHYYCALDPRSQEEEVGQSEFVYQGEAGMYFEHTTYGQFALSADPYGLLSRHNKELKKGKIKADITWLGTKTDQNTAVL